jgi:hypothetical protein
MPPAEAAAMFVPVADVGYTAISAMFKNAIESVSCSRETYL